MIFYSFRAIRGLAYLFKHYNDLDVYVEDTTCKNFYGILINRILDGKARVLRVFPLGNRDKVVEFCSKDQGDDTRPRLYIIDGDFDHLLNRRSPGLKRLYRLNVYCAENLVMCKEAVHQVGVDFMTNSDMGVIIATIDYDGFISNVVPELLELFFVYALAFQTGCSIETVGFHVYKICNSQAGPSQLDPLLVHQRRDGVIAELAKFYTIDGTRKRIDEIRKMFHNNRFQGIHVISGKTYLFPLLWAHLRRTIRYQGSTDTLLVQLARHVRLDIDTGLANAINMTAKGLLYRQST